MTAQEVRPPHPSNHRLTGVLFAVALALLAGTAQAQTQARVQQLDILSYNYPYAQGETITVGVLFNQSVTVTGSPILELILDSGTVRMRHTNFISSATRGLTFSYAVQPGDEDPTGISIGANALKLNGGSITDQVGNPVDLNLAGHTINITNDLFDPVHLVDGIPPQVTNLTFTTSPPDHIFAGYPAWYYWMDPDIKVRVDFAEPVTVTGAPILRLDIGERRVMARYDASVHNANDRSVGFAYSVQEGDLDRDGISIAADALAAVGTNTITDALGNRTDDTSLAGHAIHNDPDQRVDAVRPQISGLSIISRPVDGGTYRAGETIELRVTFDEDLLIHPPSFEEFEPITLDSGVVMAEVTINPQSHDVSGSIYPYHTINEMVLRYTVQAGDYDADGISYLGTPRNGRTIFLAATRFQDLASNLLNIDIPDLIITNAEGHKVDGGGPRVTRVAISRGSSPPNGAPYRAGEVISVSLYFNQTIVGDLDNLRLTLNLGSAAVVSQQPDFPPSSLNRYAFFTYTVQDGDLDQDGISIAADALSLTSGSVTNAAGTPLILSLAGHTITNDGEHKVDAAAPKVVDLSIISTPADGEAYRVGERIRIQLTLDELVMPFAQPTLSIPLLIGEVRRRLTHQVLSPLNVLIATYQVQGGLDEDGISVGQGGLEVTGGSLTDAVGNPLELSLAGHIITNDPEHKVGAVPRFTAADALPEQTYTVGQPVRLPLPQAIGGVAPLRYELRGDLPPGLAFDTDTRILSGTPNAPVDAAELQLVVTDALPSFGILPPFRVTVVAAPSFGDASIDNQTYTVSATVTDLPLPAATSDLPLTYTLTPPPAGLAFDPDTRTLSGTPSAPTMPTKMALTATDSNGISTRLGFQVSVAERPTFGDTIIAGLALTAEMPPINILLPAATGGVAPLTHTLSQPTAGLFFDRSTRRLSGTPRDATEATMAYGATDSNGASVATNLTFSLSVAPPLRFVQTRIQDQIFTLGRPVLLTLPTATSGGRGDKQYTLNEDALPGWVKYDQTTHTLSGTPPAVTKPILLRWQVSDVNRATATLEFNFSVVNQPSFTGISVDEQIYTATAAIPDLLLPAPNHGAQPLSYTLVPVPEGLSFDRETRTLSGTPTLPTAITELELTATGNNGASDRLRFRVTVAKPPRFVSEVEDMLIRAKRHTVPMILPHAEDGHGSFTYNLQERRDGRLRNLPEYTLFDPASRELKIYSKVRVYTLVYTATDTNGAVATQDFIVTATKPQLPPALGYTFDRGVPITPVVLPAATGGIGAVTYSFSGPALGFKFDPDTRIMSGTPRIASADLPDTYFLYYYSAQDEAGGGGTTQLQIRVRENSVFPPYIPMFFDPPLSDDLLITRGIAFERVFPAPMGGTGANPLFNYSTHFESLPQGIQFERYTRRLHGTAAQVTSGGGYPFRYTVADVGSVREQIVAHLKIKVVEQPSFAEPLRLSLRQNERLPDAPAEQIKLPAAIDGAPPLVYTLEGGMPPGLAFDAATRALSGTPTEDGASTLIYTATDANGAVASGDFVFTVVDTVRPEVTGLAIISTPSRDTAPYETKTQDTYLLGERIRMRLDFSEPVLVAADVSPKPILHLNLEIGSTDIPIQFHFPADSNAPVMALEGSYLVQEGDLDEDGISSSQLFLAGVPAEITDAAGNELDLHAPGLPTNPTHKVDGVVPKVSLVLVRRSPANHDTYRLGEEIKVLIAFDSLFPLSLGQLSLQLTLDSGVVTSRNSGTHQGIGSHGRGFDFSYVVQAGDGDENGISIGADALMLVAGESITDESGNPVNLSLAEFAFTDDPRYKVDTAAPRVTAMSVISTPRLAGHYSAGERITARVDFNEPVTVADGTTPVLQMSLGDDAPRLVAMEYETVQAGDASMLFGYTVQAGDEDHNGVGIGADALSVTGGDPTTVTDAVGNPAANLDLTAFAFENDSEHKVDGVGPQVTNVSITSRPEQFGYYAVGERITARVDFSESVTVADGTTPVLSMSLGDATPRLVAMEYEEVQAGADSMLFGYTVQTGDEDNNGIGIGADALEVTGGSLTDTLGNPAADLGLTAFAIENDSEHKVDGVPPDITAPADMTFEATAAETPLTAGTATSTDTTATISSNAPLAFPLGATPIIWTATDPAGNEMMDTQVVTVVDTTPPDITAPGNITKEATGPTTPVTVGLATATDLVTDPVTITRTPTGNDFTVGTHTITWKADDGNGNTSTAEQTITITDTTKPSIALLGDNPQTVEFGSIYNDPGATATDAVDDNDELTTQIAAASTVNTGTVGDYTVTYTVSDKATNAATPVIRIVTVTDTAAPTITAPADITLEATDTLTPLGRTHYGTATSTDREAMITDDAPLAFPVGVHTITWRATDTNSLFSTAAQTITITDTTAPDIAAPRNITKEATGPTTPVTVGLATATDLVTASVTITRSPTDDAFAVGTHTITWKADDGNGNIITAEQTITITDTTKPVIALLGADPQTVEFGSIYNDPGATATDAVDDNAVLTTQIAAASTVDTGAVGDHTVTYTVSDKATNVATPVIRMVTVTDTAAPTITAPADITFEATDTLTPLDRTHYGTATSGDDTADITDDAPDAFPLGDTPITWRATDTNSLFSTAEQTITITDTTKPDITAPRNITKEATGPTTPVTVGLATATDLVTDPVTITRTPTGNDFTVGTHTITWKADDDNGNIITAEQTVTITDTTPPVIALLGADPQTVEFGSIYNDPGATATDAVDDNDELTTQIAAASTVDTGAVGDYTVTYTVSDTATNAATPVIRMVTVTDTAAPDISPPADITFEATDTLTPLDRSDYGTATSGDDTADITDDAPDAFPLGATTITWTATDPATNEMIATQVVTIVDTTKPVIALLGADPQTVEFGTTYTELNATATDEVDDDDELTRRIVIDANAVDVDLIGTYAVTYDVSDAEGNNADRVTRMVMVTDTVIPDITAPLAMTFEATDTLTPLSRSDYGTATSGDDTADITDDAPLAFSVGVHTITWTATDTNTLFSTAAQTITITDTTAPDITAPGNITEEATGPTTPVTVGLATATDLVTASVTITRTPEGNEFAVGTHTITWKADDGNGNIITAEQTITITDTTKPVIALLGANPQTVEFGSTYTDPDATATDLVDDDIKLTEKIHAVSTVDTGTVGDYTVTYTVSDTATNAATPVIRMVTVTDTAAPDITAPAAYTTEATATLTPLGRTHYGTATSPDREAMITDDAPPVFPLGDTPITWTATDTNTLFSTAAQTITITDTTKPDITAPRNITKEAIAPTTPVTVGLATATDLVTDPVIITRTPEGNEFAVGTHTITWKADDDNGNTITAAQTITITDTTKPVIVLLGDNPQTVEFGSIYNDPGATATDAVDDDDELTIQIAAVSTVDTGTVGDYTVTYTVSDKATNVATPVIRMVMVTDTSAPSITAPADITFEATDTLTPLGRTHYGTATSTDREAMITDDAPLAFPLGDTPITWRATDTNTLFSTAAQTITITDTTKPDITAPENITKEATGPTTPVTVGQAIATDLVTDPVIITRTPEADAFAVGTHTITWKADDGNGNIITAEQTVTITDTTKPSIALLGDNPQTVEFGTAYTELNATATDEVDDDIKLTARIVADASTVDTGTVGDYTVTYTVSDKATNAATPVIRMVMVTDTAAPDIIAPADITFEATDTLTPLGRTHYGIATSSDDTAKITDNAPPVFPLGPTTITWTATDKSTNEMMDTQVVTIVDTTKPDIAAPRNITEEATGPTTPVTVGQATATDLVTASVTITRSPTDDAFAVGVHKIIWTADDDNGNTSTAEQTITITDTTKPVIVLLGDNPQTVEFGSVYNDPGATATDAVDDDDELTTRIAAASTVDTGTVGDYTVTYTVSDTATNAATPVIRMVIVTDTAAPDITAPADITFEATDTLTPLGRTHYGTATSSDREAMITDDAPPVFPLGPTTITWTATDKSTNEMIATQVVTIVDTTKPDITAPENITEEATAPTTPVTVGLATATDLVTDPVIITRTPEADAFAVGTHTITWKADDGNGNTITAAQTITITDTTKPVITLTNDNADSNTVELGSAYTEHGATATDAVDDNTELTRRIAINAGAVDVDLIGTYPVTYDVSDAEGNAADRVTRMVMVTDTVIPDITAPLAITFEATNTLTPLGRSDYGTATSGDDTADITDDAPDAFPLGATTITWTATDPATNEMMATQVVTIVDTTKPVIALLGTNPQTVEFGSIYNDPGATATDAVDDNDELTTRIAAVSTVNTGTVGDYTITYTVSDKATNAATPVLRMVMVTDTTEPDISPPAAYTTEATATLTPLDRTHYGIATSGDDTADITDDAPDAFPLGATTITWTATDPATNEMIATQVVTIVDTTKPVIALLGTNPQTVEFGSIYNDPGATATDAVDDDDELTIRIAAVSTVDTGTVGDYTVTYTVSDKATNVATPVTRMVTVTDTVIPDITAPADITFEATDTLTPLNRTHYGIATSGDDTADITDDAPDAFPLGATTITWTATDKSNNEDRATQVVTVVDTTKPDITAPRNITKEATAPTTPVTVGLATATDLVTDPVIITRTPEADAFAVGTHTITWKADDDNGNIITAAQTITITDTTKPVIVLLGDNPQTVEFGSVYSDPGATATDAVDDNDELTTQIAAASTVNTGTVGDYTVTYTVSDKATNVATPVTRMVTVTDTAAPDITPPANITFEATDTLTPLGRSDYGTATSGDDTADITDDAPDAFPLGATTITWTATDPATNEMMATQVVTIVDTTKPVIALLGADPQTVEFGTTYTELNATATDEVDDDIKLTARIVADASTVNTGTVGDYTVTYTVSDKATNAATPVIRMVTVTDTVMPDISPPADITFEATDTLTPLGRTHYGTATSGDDTADITDDAPDAFPLGDTPITWRATDTNDLFSTAAQTITITDTTKPDITAPRNITKEATAPTTPVTVGLATATDLVTDPVIITRSPEGNEFAVGTHTITWKADDDNGNIITAAQTITITDTTKPVIALLGDNPQTVEFGSIYNDPGATATDAVDDNAMLTTQIAAVSTVDTGTVGDYTVTYTVSDTATNAATPVLRMVTVTDTEAPDISPPADITFEATDTLTSLGRTHYGTATSGDDTANITDDAPDAFPLGATTITWTATDPATNEMMATQVVTIVDTTPPVIALLGADPQTVEFGSIYNDPGATATDAVDDNDELTIRIAAASTVNTGTVGDYIVTYTVSDKATNAATPVLRMVTVTDTAAPSITAPADITFEATDTLTPLSRSDYGTATSGDDTADISDDAPDAFPLGDTPITWRATDTNSMFSTAEQTITITDTTKPVITLTNDNADSNTVELGSAYTEHGATATDAVDDNTELTRRIAINAGAVDVNRLGTYPVTYDVSDAEGNAADRVTRTVMVTDTTEPDITAPLAMTFEATDTLTPLNRTHYGIATSGDDTADITDDAPDAFPLGATTITWTATDKSNNEDRATQVVTVVDTTKPDITAPRNITKEATAPTTPVTVGLATATDLVTDPVIITRTPEADAFAVGTHTITWKADDDNGNIITAAQTITITDTTKPVIVLLGDNPQTVEFGSVYSDPGATATDAVDDNDELTTQIAAASTVNTGTVGDYTVTYTVSDKATNVATPVTRMVTVTDTAAPDIIAPNTYTTEATATLTPLDRADYGIATSTDGNADITDDAPDAFPLGDTTITWTATDKSTNEMMDTQVVTVVDTTKPDIAAPRNITKEATGPTTPVTVGQATATDLVTDPVIITRSPEGNEFAVGTHTITWKADDGNGNIITAEQTITITDTTKPSIVLLGDNPQTVEFGTAYTELNATATDEVDDDIKLTARIVADANAVDTGTVGDYTVTYTVSDKATNVATPVTRMVTVTDTTEPDITAPLAMTFEATDTLTPLSRSDYGTATSGDDTADITDDAPDAFPLGATTITWTATDKSTNEMIATQVVTIVDTTKPVIALLGADPQTVEFGTTYTELNATATDEVDDDDELTRRIVIDANAVDVDLIGTYAVTYDVTDAEGNAADRVTRMVTVTDTAAPDITAPAAYTTEATATLTPLSRSDYGTATSGDDTADITDDAPDAFPLGATTITWTATDPATNEMMATQVVTIVDTTPPDIALLGADPQTVEFGSIYNDPGATATDAVDDNDELTTQIAAASTVNTGTVGDYTVTYTVSDKATNAATPVIRIVTVTDTAAPDITAPADITFEATDTLTPLSRSDYGTATSGDDTADITDDAPDAFPLGETTITWTATDKSNNEMIATQMVTVEDTTAPMITMNGASPQTVKPGSTYSDPGATATDLVDNDAELTEKIVAVSTVDMGTVGQYTITYDVTDAEDNPADTVTRMVMVTNTPLDTTAPIITLLGDNPMTIEVGEDYMEPGATAFDRMDGDRTDQIMIDATEVDTNTVGTYTATYSVADLQDNQAQASRSVQVLASPDLADLNRVILSEVARTMADQNVGVVARRVEQAGQNVAHATSVGGQSNLANILAAQGRALADDQFNLKQLLAEAEFALPLSADAAPGVSVPTFWGTGDYRQIDSTDQLHWDGDFLSLHLGADAHMDDMVGGVALSWSRAELDYRNYHTPQTATHAGRNNASGEYEVDMTSVHPYMGWTSGQMDFWATLGYSDGKLKITDQGDDGKDMRRASSDLDLRTVAVGGSGPLLNDGATNLRVKTEALHSELIVAGDAQIAALSLTVSRLRLTLEATRNWALYNGAQLDLSWQGGLRYDGGAGNTGAGNEIGGGLRYVDAARGLTLEGKARGLVTDKGDTQEWGISGLIKFQGSPHGHGLSFSLTPEYGEADPDRQEFWQRDLREDDDDAEVAEASEYAARWDVRLGYGISGPGGHGLLTPYSEITLANNGNTYRLGLAWKLDSLFDVKLVTERRHSIDESEQRVILQGTITF